jgi:hypothetical protein
MQVIVGLDAKVGQLGLYFPPGGILSTEFAVEHKLAKSAGGYLPDHKPRVEAMKLRGIPSYGLFVPVIDAEHVKGAWQDGELVGEPICKKYLPPNQGAHTMSTGKTAKKDATFGLPRHYDTPQVWNVIKQIPIGARVYVTEKIHGTSGRSGLIKRPKAKGLFGWVKSLFQSEYVYVCGSRNVEFQIGSEKGARYVAHSKLQPLIQPGEVWYYELFGWDGQSKIQQDLTNDKKVQVSYTYGLLPNTHGTFVYRIQDKSGRDLTPVEVWSLTVNQHPLSYYSNEPTYFIHESASKTMVRLRDEANTESKMDKNTISEGIVAVFTDPNGQEVIGVAKLKSQEFCEMEGIAYGGDKYIDAEEAA